MSNSKLVWSDDPKDKKKLEDEGKKTKPNDDLVLADKNWTAVFRLEKNGRGGKTVTVISKLPRHDTFLRELTRELKSKCGSGGTHSLDSEGGTIEIQGDKREAIKQIFDKKGIKYKGM